MLHLLVMNHIKMLYKELFPCALPLISHTFTDIANDNLPLQLAASFRVGVCSDAARSACSKMASVELGALH